MKIIYYTSGITGSGRIVRAISLYNAFVRKNFQCDFVIVSNSEMNTLADLCGIKQIKLPIENENLLLSKECRNSVLYKVLIELKPDIILFDLVWYTTIKFIQDFECKKIFLCRQVEDHFFSITLSDHKIFFNPNHFDFIYAIEPFKTSIDMRILNPLIIRNRDEIFLRDKALKKLKIKTDKKNCLLSYNGEPGEFEIIKKEFSYLKDEGYSILYSTYYSADSIFPAVDYFNAFDFIVTGAGYNSFWEMVFFNKEGITVPVLRNFENQRWRVENCQEYYFEENGADQLVDIIVNI